MVGLTRATREFSAEFFITAVGAIDQMAGNLDRFVFNEALKEAICTAISLEGKSSYSCPREEFC